MSLCFVWWYDEMWVSWKVFSSSKDIKNYLIEKHHLNGFSWHFQLRTQWPFKVRKTWLCTSGEIINGQYFSNQSHTETGTGSACKLISRAWKGRTRTVYCYYCYGQTETLIFIYFVLNFPTKGTKGFLSFPASQDW